MRSLWNTLSFLAVVNLLALGLFVGWLGWSGRLSTERMRELRALFEPTVADADAAAELAADEAEMAVNEAQDAARAADPQLPSRDELAAARLVSQREADARRRLDDIADQRREEHEARSAALQARIEAFEAEKAAWEDTFDEERARRSDEQFAKVVKLWENAPSKNVKGWVADLVRDGNIDQAVAYLNAMQPRAASKLFALYKTEEDANLANELQERIRRLGLPDGEKDASDDDAAALAASDAGNDLTP